MRRLSAASRASNSARLERVREPTARSSALGGPSAHSRLSGRDFPVARPAVSVLPDVFALHGRGDRGTWLLAGCLAWREADRSLPPVSPRWNRSSALKTRIDDRMHRLSLVSAAGSTTPAMPDLEYPTTRRQPSTPPPMLSPYMKAGIALSSGSRLLMN